MPHGCPQHRPQRRLAAGRLALARINSQTERYGQCKQWRTATIDSHIELALSNVVLPAPLAPMSSVRVPGCRLTLMSRTTGDAPGCGRPSGAGHKHG